ncbi:MAG TPA: hypothetical protein VFD84_04695 [Candidatus Binatia bacterium]|nr:hypothetical protein [Candidatus Binatia bacterium]
MPYYDRAGEYRLDLRERVLLERLLPECERDELRSVVDGVRRVLARLSSREGRMVGLVEFTRRREATARRFAARWRGPRDGEEFFAGCLAELLREHPIA